MGSKLGLLEAKKEDEKLITELLDWMHQSSADFTNTFRDFCKSDLPDKEAYLNKNFQNWHTRWQLRLEKEEQGLDSSLALMRSVNPSVIPRNHKVEEALQAGEEGDLNPSLNLLKALENPYDDRDLQTPYQTPPKPSERVLQTFCGT